MRCNAYGAETATGHATPYGGLVDVPVVQAHYCPAEASHRFRWVCANGHAGDIVPLCEQHYGEFMGLREARMDGHRTPIAWNLRRDVQSCPRCAAEAPECRNPEHQAMLRGRSGKAGRCGCMEPKVAVRLVSVS